MLVFSRKLGERIVIDETIKLTVIAIRGDRVQLGLYAPQEVTIHRVEMNGRSGYRKSDGEDRVSRG